MPVSEVPNAGNLVAIVDDDQAVRDAIRGLLRSVGFAAQAFSSAQEFLSSANISRVACLVADVNMPNMSGPDLHQKLLIQGQAIPTILITAYPNDNDQARAIQTGVLCYLTKPFDEDDLLNCIRDALHGGKGRGSTS
jgi:FixJ family two-component response regulator